MAGSLQGAISTMILPAGGLIRIENHSIIDSVVGAAAGATYSLNSNGQASFNTVNGGSGNYANEWTNPVTSGLGGSYEVRATLNSGSLDGSSSATGVWLALSSVRAWSVARGSAGTQTANLTIEIRPNSGSVADSATIDLEATWS